MLSTPLVSLWGQLRPYSEIPQEAYAVYAVDGDNSGQTQIIALGKDNVVVAPSSLIEDACRRLKATRVILAHNHPFSHTPSPSFEDLRASANCVSYLKKRGIAVDDMLILSGRGYFSFLEYGILGLPLEESWALSKVINITQKGIARLAKMRAWLKAKHPLGKVLKEARKTGGFTRW